MTDTAEAESLWTAFLASSGSDRAAILDQLGAEQLGAVLCAMGVDARREALGEVAREGQAEILGRLSQEALIALGRQGVAALGTYRAQLTKRERIRGALSAAQTLELTVRSTPFAFRLEFKSGPSSGRRALYNAEIRKDEIRIKEGGMLGIAGALWLQLDNPLTRIDTNHRATEIGFAALLDLMETDMAKAAAAGAKHSRRDVGFEGDTYGCIFDAPPGVSGLYAVSTRVGFDVASSLPVSVDVHDDKGLLESYRYSAAKGASVAADFFTLKAASL